MISIETIINILGNILGPLAVGYVIWRIGENATDKRMKNDAIRDLMTFRGDYSGTDFSRALNKISITFHDDQETRKETRNLWETINDPASREEYVKRKIVGLIHNLCKNNGFEGLTEYDIDQAFLETKQTGPTTSDLDFSKQPTPKSVQKTIKRRRKKS